MQYYVYVNVEARDIYWALRLNRSILTLFGYVRQSVSAFVGPSDRPTDRPTDQSNERTNQQNDDPGSVRPSVAVVGRSSTGAKEGRGKEEEERANEQAVKAGRASLLSAARSLARSLATTTTYYLLHSGRSEGRKERRARAPRRACGQLARTGRKVPVVARLSDAAAAHFFDRANGRSGGRGPGERKEGSVGVRARKFCPCRLLARTAAALASTAAAGAQLGCRKLRTIRE